MVGADNGEVDTGGVGAIRLTPSGSGTLLKVSARPGARRSAILGPHGDSLRVAVRSAPEKGRANAELESLLAAAFGIPRSAASVVRGSTSRTKSVLLGGLAVGTARERLNALLGGA